MKKNMQNIVLISLDTNFVKNISASLASVLDMHFSDIKELIEYELVDSGAILEKCGIDYLRERECSAIKNALGFKDTVLSCNYDLYKHNKKLFNDNLVCYLKLPLKTLEKKDIINSLAFQSHDEFLEKNCDLLCLLKGKSEKLAVKKLIDDLGGYYENQ